MTFCSTIGSLFMMPLWLYTLGTVLTEQAKITIPFLHLLPNLLITIVPCLVGLGISQISPKIKQFSIKIAKVFTLCVSITLLGSMFFLKFYIFMLIKSRTWLVCFIRKYIFF
jgi:hypothetical protein